MSLFKSVTLLPPDPILNLPIIFAADPRPNKINLGIGVYYDDDGKQVLLSSVRQAEVNLIKEDQPKNYLPIDGDPMYLQSTMELIFGQEILKNLSGRILSAQSIGGTNALRIGADLLFRETSRKVFISNPTWPTHKLIFEQSGFEVGTYDYYDSTHNCFNFNAMSESILKMPSGSVIVLHAVCHNPTGIDPSFEQWKQLSELIKKQNILPFFDFAYQGFGDSTDEDAKAIRYFAAQGHEMLVGSSFSKNFGLYGERVGSITIITNDPETSPKIRSQLKQRIRATYSNPPCHGAQIVAHILQNKSLKKLWLEELAAMRNRMKQLRLALAQGLAEGSNQRNWNFMKEQKGFFSFCGLSSIEVQRLIKEHAIIVPDNGRINVAGLNHHNLNQVIAAIDTVTSQTITNV